MVINKNIIMSSFKSSGDIQKKEGGPDSCDFLSIKGLQIDTDIANIQKKR